MFKHMLISGIALCAVYQPVPGYADDTLENSKIGQASLDISLPLVMDDNYLGDIQARIRGEIVAIKTERAIALLTSILTDSAIDALTSSWTDEYVVVSDIHADGLTFSFNPQLLQIEIKTDLDARKIRQISLRNTDYLSSNEPLVPADYSLFITPSIGLSYLWQGDRSREKGLQPIFGQVDLGGRIGQEKGVAFSSRLKFRSGENGNLYRSRTRVYYDILPKFIRGTAGDIVTRGESFQIAPSMAGIKVEKFFDFDPRRTIRPVGKALFELDRASTVEVFNNGAMRFRRDLESGRYNLNDLILAQGGNNIELRITDDMGREQVLSHTDFYDFGLLQAGMSDFSVAIGVKSRSNTNRISYSDEPILSAFYRRGLSDQLTASTNLQADSHGANGGATALWATPLGSFQIEGGLSSYKGQGTGIALASQYRVDRNIGERTTGSLNLSSRYKSANFSAAPAMSTTTPITLERDRYKNIELKAEARLTSDNWSASSFVNYSDVQNRQRLNLGIGSTIRVTSDLSLSAFAQHSQGDSDSEQSVLLQATWKIGNRRNARAQYDSGRNRAFLRYSKTSPQYINNISYGLGASYELDENQTDIFGNANFKGNRFEASARHMIAMGGHQTDTDQQTSHFNISSSLVFADGAFGIARPVNNNFAILSSHKSLAGKEIIVNPSSDGVTAKSDFLGPPIATQISPFSTRVTYIDVDELPIGYDIGSNGFATHPYLFSGYKYQVGTGASFSIIGKVFNSETGKPITYLGGKFQSLDTPDAEPVAAFTNRNGRLAATGLLSGRHRLTLFTKPAFSMEIDIPDTSESLIILEDIEVSLK